MTALLKYLIVLLEYNYLLVYCDFERGLAPLLSL